MIHRLSLLFLFNLLFTFLVIVVLLALTRTVSAQTPEPSPTATATAVPTSTPTPVPSPTPLPTATAFPSVLPQVQFYTTPACDRFALRADYVGGNQVYRVIITRNNVVQSLPSNDLFGTTYGIYGDGGLLPVSYQYRAFAFVLSQAPVVVPGQLFDSASGLVGQVQVSQSVSCVATPFVVPPTPVATAAPPLDVVGTVTAVLAAQKPVAVPSAPTSVIRPPSTGSAGLLP